MLLMQLMAINLSDKKYIIDNKELIKEWDYDKNDGIDPNGIGIGSHKKAWWICDKGHVWEAIISSRNKGAGCMLCYRESRKKH